MYFMFARFTELTGCIKNNTAVTALSNSQREAFQLHVSVISYFASYRDCSV